MHLLVIVWEIIDIILFIFIIMPGKKEMVKRHQGKVWSRVIEKEVVWKKDCQIFNLKDLFG